MQRPHLGFDGFAIALTLAPDSRLAKRKRWLTDRKSLSLFSRGARGRTG